MLFNSLTFAVFLPLVFGVYWALRRRPLRLQNALLLAASYVFYGWWDWRFLFLIVLSSAVDYVVGLGLHRSEEAGRRKAWLALSLGVNLGLLGVFKYYDFFILSFAEMVTSVGLHADVRTLRFILPVGISFYTFQTLSYTIDVYRRDMAPTRDALAFFAYVAFFPQLVAGPIERARHLLPQFLARRTFRTEQAKDGLRQILWGLFKKVVVADTLAPYVELIYGNYTAYDGPLLFAATLCFAVQIYCDFSGYSDIAIGTARLFGFDLMRNFAYPYFSRDIGEFWRRWHISLSTWFRDYVYLPLGGNRTATRARHLFNLIATFTISGFWHGANWTFVVWGLLNGLYYVPLVLAGRHKRHTGTVASGRLLPSPREVLQMGATFGLALLAWVFFRADSVAHAVGILGRMVTTPWVDVPLIAATVPFLAILFVVEWVQREREHALQVEALPAWGRWGVYYSVVLLIFFFGNTGHVPFIYFQF